MITSIQSNIGNRRSNSGSRRSRLSRHTINTLTINYIVKKDFFCTDKGIYDEKESLKPLTLLPEDEEKVRELLRFIQKSNPMFGLQILKYLTLFIVAITASLLFFSIIAGVIGIGVAIIVACYIRKRLHFKLYENYQAKIDNAAEDQNTNSRRFKLIKLDLTTDKEATKLEEMVIKCRILKTGVFGLRTGEDGSQYVQTTGRLISSSSPRDKLGALNPTMGKMRSILKSVSGNMSSNKSYVESRKSVRFSSKSPAPAERKKKIVRDDSLDKVPTPRIVPNGKNQQTAPSLHLRKYLQKKESETKRSRLHHKMLSLRFDMVRMEDSYRKRNSLPI